MLVIITINFMPENTYEAPKDLFGHQYKEGSGRNHVDYSNLEKIHELDGTQLELPLNDTLFNQS